MAAQGGHASLWLRKTGMVGSEEPTKMPVSFN